MKKPSLRISGMSGISNIIGYLVLSFGLGMLITCFLPPCVLVVIEAIVIIVAGILCLTGR